MAHITPLEQDREERIRYQLALTSDDDLTGGQVEVAVVPGRPEAADRRAFPLTAAGGVWTAEFTVGADGDFPVVEPGQRRVWWRMVGSEVYAHEVGRITVG